MNLTELKIAIINGYKITKQEALALQNEPLIDLWAVANEIRHHFCGNAFDMCTIINGKSGKCSENCKFCAQSSFYQTQIEQYPLLNQANIVEDAIHQDKQGVLRYSVVTSGRGLSDLEVNQMCETYKEIQRNSEISLCASHGLLSIEQFKKLKAAGVARYHNNLETCAKYFEQVCTTHTYQDKILAIEQAQAAGLEVCSGGIMGMGESMEDRIDLFFDIKRLGIKSIPINVLNPIPGTPFETLSKLSNEEVCTLVAICRLINPSAAIRLAGGRCLLPDKGERLFFSGANAAITGDMLTTAGISVEQDMALVRRLGYEVKML
ncbi:MAG: biotin synthase BioB [Turicibacter sp.]